MVYFRLWSTIGGFGILFIIFVGVFRGLRVSIMGNFIYFIKIMCYFGEGGLFGVLRYQGGLRTGHGTNDDASYTSILQ